MFNIPKTTHITSAAVTASLMITLVSEPVSAAGSTCNGLPSQADLKTALLGAVGSSNGGLNNNMWATIVNADGIVCAVAFSGSNRKEQWLLSRVMQLGWSSPAPLRTDSGANPRLKRSISKVLL
jgi:dienelactone hydrolase